MKARYTVVVLLVGLGMVVAGVWLATSPSRDGVSSSQAWTGHMQWPRTLVSAPACERHDMEQWRLVGDVDDTARRATLYSNQEGSRQVAPGMMLGHGIHVKAMQPHSVTLDCGESMSLVLNAPAPRPPSPPLTAPLGN